MPVTPHHTDDSPSIKQSFINGIAWTGTAQLATQFITFATTLILPRLLQPTDFGVVAMANIVIGLVNIVNDLGLGAAIIQRSQLKHSHLNSVFIANNILSLTLFLSLLSISTAVAAFYENPAIQPVLSVLSITFLFRGASAVHYTFMLKNLEYQKIATITLSGVIIQALIAIVLALFQFGSWALVSSQVIGTLFISIGFWTASAWSPKWKFDWQAFSELISFSSNVLGARVVGYMGRNVDNLIVGKFLGAAALGYYDLAYRWASLPRQRLFDVVLEVMYPTLSLIQDDNAQLREWYTKLLNYIALITFPIYTGLILITPSMIYLLYGDLWSPVILPLQILCFGAMPAALGAPMGIVLRVKGRPDLELKMAIISVGLLSMLVFVGLKYGLVGIAIAVTLKSAILLGVFGLKTNSLIDLMLSEYLIALSTAIKTTFVMGILLLMIQVLLNTYMPSYIFWHVLILSSTGALICFLVIKFFSPTQWSSIKRLLLQMFPVSAAANRILKVIK